jgi:hypothetical protein
MAEPIQLSPEEQEAMMQSAQNDIQDNNSGMPPVRQYVPSVEGTPQETGTPKQPAGENLEKSKDWQSLEAQKKHFQEKSQKLEEELRKYKGSPTNTPSQPSSDNMETIKVSRLLADYNDDESDFILKNSGSSSYNAIKSTLDNDWIKDAIKARREKVAREKMTPAPSGASGGFSPDLEIKSDMSEGDVIEIQRKRLQQAESEGRAEV